METKTLRNGHTTVSGPSDGRERDRPVSSILEAYYDRHPELRGIPGEIIRKAWFSMAHLILRPGSTVVDMGPNPMMTYAMAILNPDLNFIGVDIDRKLIRESKKHFIAPNLEFRVGDISTSGGFEPGSVDAVINSFILHEIYSSQKFFDSPVISALENHFSILKKEGLMFIRDFAMPPPEQFVWLEMPEKESKSEAINDLSEADLLVWYSQHARPQGSKVYKGFFLEELPQRFPQTRLFRLPYKWAYEFIMRKDDRKHLQEDLTKEYAFFTQREYRKNLRALGARVLYTAPQWDDAVIRECFDGHFRLYSDEGKPLGWPPTSFIAVAQKIGENRSLSLHELRPSHSMDNKIRITAMRNDTNGQIFDIVSRDMNLTEILPYRVTETGQLNIFIHDGLPRGIANAVPRLGKELDGRRWSGHMSEAIAVPSELITDIENGQPKDVVLFARDHLGLKPAMGCTLEPGGSFYPAPDLIDERIGTRFLRVLEHEGPVEPRNVAQDLEGFTTKGTIREVSAQSVLNAIHVGFIPNARLETQILELCGKLGINAETWDECPLVLEVGEPESMLDFKKLMAEASGKDKRFRSVKGTAGQVRTIKSIFVDEGWVDGGLEGLASHDIEFIVTDEQTVNKAVILPLTKSPKTNDLMAGLVTEYLPVPQRHQGNGMSLRAPTITLPKEITTIDQAKRYIAEQFDVGPEKVGRLGESYFCHIGMTPTRIFPFCVATSGKRAGPLGGPVQYAPIKKLIHMLDMFFWNYDYAHITVFRFMRAYRFVGQDSEVKGDWVRSSDQVYAETLKTTPGILNSSPIAGIIDASRGRSRSVGAAPYATSPDFLDIRNENRVKVETPFSNTQSIKPAEPDTAEVYGPARPREHEHAEAEHANKQSAH